ncbi:hypothetical protein Pla144_24450 [Bythopirellula polymerisocia]|uniref:Transglycosylase associated protein n=2 Tax=Bythopirellula polymerisocia TaxID=2528003 RepID=A0A5C6CTE9_9BACT|nr:hypothetical protein Pla144_24450 [Bythopirellula polymerisocia]
MIGNIISWCVFGLIAGALARFLTPGKDPMGCFGTVGLGVAGSFLGGAISHLLFGISNQGIQPAGFIGAVIGGVFVLLLLRHFAKKT